MKFISSLKYSAIALHEALCLFGKEKKISLFLNVGTGCPPGILFITFKNFFFLFFYNSFLKIDFFSVTEASTGLKCILNAIVKSATSR
jgi:hypothetical protein